MSNVLPITFLLTTKKVIHVLCVCIYIYTYIHIYIHIYRERTFLEGNTQKNINNVQLQGGISLGSGVGLTFSLIHRMFFQFKTCVQTFFVCFIYLFIFRPQGMQDLQFSNQGSSPHSLHWKHGVLTTELPGKSPKLF